MQIRDAGILALKITWPNHIKLALVSMGFLFLFGTKLSMQIFMKTFSAMSSLMYEALKYQLLFIIPLQILLINWFGFASCI